MKDVHLVIGVLALALTGAAGPARGVVLVPRRAEPSVLDSATCGPGLIVLDVALGGILLLLGKKVSGLHIFYGVLPLLVSFLREQLRMSPPQMVLASHELESALEVGNFPRTSSVESRWRSYSASSV